MERSRTLPGRRQAFDYLQALAREAATAPDPGRVRDAALVAGRYWDVFRERFAE